MAKSKYETHVKPRFDEIEKWVSEGATQENIAKKLGISVRALLNYLRDYSDFADLFKRGRKDLVAQLRGALITKALGFNQLTKKAIKCKTIDYKDGKKVKEKEEVIFYNEESYFPPDVAALNLALKNYDKKNWSNDWQHYELKKQELEIKKKIAEENNW